MDSQQHDPHCDTKSKGEAPKKGRNKLTHPPRLFPHLAAMFRALLAKSTRYQASINGSPSDAPELTSDRYNVELMLTTESCGRFSGAAPLYSDDEMRFLVRMLKVTLARCDFTAPERQRLLELFARAAGSSHFDLLAPYQMAKRFRQHQN